jgi:predicted phosphodiesterase
MLLAFISDIHEDVRMLEKALQQAKTHRADKIICLGDITGYSPINQNFAAEKNAGACIDLLREYCEISIAGNHDMYTARRLSEYHAGIDYPNNWYDLSFAEKQKLTGNKAWLYEHEIDPQLSPDQLQWLRNLPEFATLEIGGLKIGLTHYIFPDVSGSLQMDHEVNSDAQEHRKLFGCDLYFSGHLHPQGFMVQSKATDYKWEPIDFGKEYTILKGDFVIVPACLRHSTHCGILFFDTFSNKVNAVSTVN